MDRLGIDALAWIIGVQEPQSGSDLFGRPALRQQLAANPVVQFAALGQLGTPKAARPPRVTNPARNLRAVAGILQSPPRQFPPDRAGRTAEEMVDRPKARPAPMLAQNHATFLAVEVPVSFVHRNILCPASPGCCT